MTPYGLLIHRIDQFYRLQDLDAPDLVLKTQVSLIGLAIQRLIQERGKP